MQFQTKDNLYYYKNKDYYRHTYSFRHARRKAKKKMWLFIFVIGISIGSAYGVNYICNAAQKISENGGIVNSVKKKAVKYVIDNIKKGEITQEEIEYYKSLPDSEKRKIKRMLLGE